MQRPVLVQVWHHRETNPRPHPAQKCGDDLHILAAGGFDHGGYFIARNRTHTGEPTVIDCPVGVSIPVV